MSTMTAVKERPILFSGAMVRAILEGRKTQTRRVVKPGPPPCQTGPDAMYSYRHGWRYGGVDYACERDLEVCPHGTPGDRLWVRETFMHRQAEYEYSISTSVPYLKAETLYAADVKGGVKGAGFTSGIFMPRWASRITLELTDVRVQRVQEISESDAESEGAFFTNYGRKCFHGNGVHDVGDCPAPPKTHPQREGWSMSETTSHEQCLGTPRFAFANLWNSINTDRGFGWDKNPWVFALTFRRLP